MQSVYRSDNRATFMCELSRNSGILHLLKPFQASIEIALSLFTVFSIPSKYNDDILM